MRMLVLMTALGLAVNMANAAPASKRKVMVPPPPPEISVMTAKDQSFVTSTLGVPLDFLSQPELERMRERLQRDLQILSRKQSERQESISECRTRVEKFETLFTEGVVSKRDLQHAKKELTHVEDTDVDIDQRLADLKLDLARVDKKLQSMKKPAPAAKNSAQASRPAPASKNSAQASKKQMTK